MGMKSENLNFLKIHIFKSGFEINSYQDCRRIQIIWIYGFAFYVNHYDF